MCCSFDFGMGTHLVGEGRVGSGLDGLGSLEWVRMDRVLVSWDEFDLLRGWMGNQWGWVGMGVA